MIQIKRPAYRVLAEAHIQSVLTFDDVMRICRANNWRVCSYAHARDLIFEFNLEEKARKHKGFVLRGADRTLILYSESLSTRERITVIAHEIGHIVLGHQPGDTFSHVEDAQEIEAHVFAYELVCPSIVLQRCGPWRCEELREVCPVTIDGISYYIAEMRKRILAYDPVFDQIIDQYSDMIARMRKIRRRDRTRFLGAITALFGATRW